MNPRCWIMAYSLFIFNIHSIMCSIKCNGQKKVHTSFIWIVFMLSLLSHGLKTFCFFLCVTLYVQLNLMMKTIKHTMSVVGKYFMRLFELDIFSRVIHSPHINRFQNIIKLIKCYFRRHKEYYDTITLA